MPEIETKPPTPTIAKVSEIEQKAIELKEKRALPSKPGDRVSFNELRSWLALLPSEEAEQRITIWVYRQDPIINRQLVDPSADNNIDVIYSNFGDLTEDYMIDRHGGGAYKFVVKDENKPKEQKGGFFEARLVISMTQHQPKLDLREVDWDHYKNKGFKSWARAQKMIDDKNMPIIAGKDNSVPIAGNLDPNMVSMMKMMLDFTTKMSEKDQTELKRKIGGEDALTKSMGDLMLEKMKQEDPNKQMTSMVALITAVMGKNEGKNGDLAVIMPMFMTTFTTLITQMMESGKQQFAMMMKMMEKPEKEEKDGSSKIDDLKAIIEIAREIKGGGTQHEKSTAEVIGDIVTPVLGPVIGIVGNIVAMRAAAAGVKTVETTTTGNRPIDTLHNQNTQPQPQQQPVAQIPASEAANLIAQFEPIIINKLAGPGWEFGAWVADGFGDMTAAGIVKYGVDGLLAGAKSVPSFWQKIEATYGEQHLRKWLESLVNYKEIMEQMEREEEEPEVVK